MFVGHLAVALGAKTVEPRVPLALWVGATFFLDLLWPLFLLAGLERVRVDPGNTAFTSLDFEWYPWTHSLVMALVWSGLAAVMCRRAYGTRGGMLVGAVVGSHWLLDLVTHRPDLPLWPAGPAAGLGLWESITGTLIVEGGLLVAALVMYLRASRARDLGGHLIFGSLIALSVAIWISQPWSPPPPGAMAVAATGLALWLLPAWAHWTERHRIRA